VQRKLAYSYGDTQLRMSSGQGGSLNIRDRGSAYGEITMTQEPNTNLAILRNRLKSASDHEELGILNELAGSYRDLSPKDRIAFAERALALSEKSHDYRSKAEAYNHLGVARNNLGNSQESLDLFLKALRIMEQIDDKDGISQSLVNIGQVNFYLDSFEEALKYFRRALLVRKELGNESDVAQSLLLVGNVMAKMARYDEALDYYYKALVIKKETNDRVAISQIYNNLGNVYLAIGEMEKVLEYRLQALQIDRELGNKWETALTTYNIAEYYLQIEQPEEAYPYILESQALAKDLDNKGLVRDNLYNLSLYHELRGAYQEALRYQREYSQLTKSMFSEELSEKIIEMQTKYETGKLEDLVAKRTLELQQKINELNRTENALQLSMKRLKGILDGTVRALAATVETRDSYTAGHQRRVANLACSIATNMGLSEERIEGIYLSASIHDIGKISVPAEILSMPRQLTELEFSLIKNHSQVGYEILHGIDFSAPVAKIVLQHHERMDGSGYPNGLKGDEILLEARIIAVADVVEAMSSHRPYRAALGIDQALEEISKNKGVKYDFEVVDACLKLFREGFQLKTSDSMPCYGI